MSGTFASRLRARLRGAPGPHLAREEGVVWLLGSPRSGTTWLMNQLGGVPEIVMIDEPGIGVHTGLFLHEFFGSPAENFPADRSLMTQLRADDPHYFFAQSYAGTWRPALRTLILARFGAQLERAGHPDGICLVKEPNGSQGIDVLLHALPSSRVLWLLRDGRDVVDSELDGILPGGWIEKYGASWDMTPADRLRFVEDRAVRWLRRTEYVQAAYDRLPDPQRLLLRYEELLTDTAAGLERAFAWIGHPLRPGEAAEIASRHAFERLPTEATGSRKFARAAKPGGWRENLSADEHAAMERILGPKLRELGYA